MLFQALTRFHAFQHLTTDELKTVAQHTQVLTVPGARWLLQPPRQLPGFFYLVAGRLQADGVVIAANDQRARQAIIPGSLRVKTLSTVQMLRVDTQPIAFLLEPSDDKVNDLQTFVVDDWLERFLGSRIMQKLNPTGWQQVLATLEPHAVEKGEIIIRRGEVGAHFYVIRGGRFEVINNQNRLAILNSGDFFGEDAIISGGPRNATVKALCAGALMVLHKSAFQKLLQDSVVRFVGGKPGLVLSVDKSMPHMDSYIALSELREKSHQLDRHRTWLVTAGTLERAALGTFILTHQGFDAAVYCPQLNIEPKLRPVPFDLLPIGGVD